MSRKEIGDWQVGMLREKPRMLIIGSRGFLGGHATQAAKKEFTVIEGNRTSAGRPSEVEIDVRNESSVKAAFQSVQPDIVLLLAAISDIDQCEKFPEEARAVNLRGAEHVADACARVHARLMFTSTGAVFDGRNHGYLEESPLSPISVYGESKARAETSVLALVSSAIVIRLALVLGFAERQDTNALLNNLKKRWTAGETVALPVFELRNPIDAITTSNFMLALLKKQDVRGVFHVGCADSITRYDLGVKLASRMGFTGLVRPQLEPMPGRAPRGADHFLKTDKLRKTCTIPIPTCDQVIERCLSGVA